MVETNAEYIKRYPCNDVRKRAFDLATALPLEKKPCLDKMSPSKKKEFCGAHVHELDGMTDTSFQDFIEREFGKIETPGMHMEGMFLDGAGMAEIQVKAKPDEGEIEELAASLMHRHRG